MANEIVVGSAVLSGVETLFATLTTWHPFVDVYVDGTSEAVVPGSEWRVYAVTAGTRTRLAAGIFDAADPSQGQRVCFKVPGLGTTIELRAYTPHGTSAAPVRAAIVGWDSATATAAPSNVSDAAVNLSPGPEVNIASIVWHPNVRAIVQGAERAKGSVWNLRAVIAGFANAILAGGAAFADVAPSRIVAEAEGGASSWLLTAVAPAGTTGPVTAAIFGYSAGAEGTDPASVTEVVWRPGVASGGNHVATWAEVETFIVATGGLVDVYIDDTSGACVVPATANTACNGLTRLLPGASGAVFSIADGGRLQDPGTIAVPCSCRATVRSPILCSVRKGIFRVTGITGGTGAQAVGVKLSLLAGSTQPFLAFLNNAFLDPSTLVTSDGGGLDNSAVPAQILVQLVANAVVNWVNTTQIGGVMSPNTVAGAPFTNLNYSGDTTAPFVTQASFAGALVVEQLDTTGPAFVYRQGEPAPSGNVFGSFREAFDAGVASKVPFTIFVDDRLGAPVVTPGAYNLIECTLAGFTYLGYAFVNLTIPAGVTWTNLYRIRQSLQLISTSTGPIVTVAALEQAFVSIEEFSSLRATTSPFFHILATGSLELSSHLVSNYFNAGSQIANIDAGGTFEIDIEGPGASIQPNILIGAGNATYYLDDLTMVTFSTANAGYTGVLTLNCDALSKYLMFTDTAPLLVAAPALGAGNGSVDEAIASLKSLNVTGRPSTAVGALNLDWSTSNTFSKTIAANSVFTFSNTSDGQIIVARITAGAGNTVTWPAVLWPGGAAPTQTNPGTDVYTFVRIGATIYGSASQAMA